jgi:sodium/hydrogen antiporter
MSDLGLLAAVVLAYSLISRRAERANVSAPIGFLAAGFLLGPAGLDAVEASLTDGAGLVVAEVALVVVLFADAARLDLSRLRGNAALPARLLGIGMPLTIALGTAGGAALLGGLDFWEAAIVATVLAPTDAALGQAVVSSKDVPVRIRQALDVEAGLNDGLSIPFLALFVALAADQAGVQVSDWLAFAAKQIGYGALTGIVVGALGSWLVDRAARREWIGGVFEPLAFLSLAVLAWALAGELGGNGFIGAFVAGLSASRVTERSGPQALEFTEGEGQLLSLSVFFLLGVAAEDFLKPLDWEIALYAVLSLTAIRMLAVAFGSLGSGLRPSSIAFLGWFGSRGLASIILALSVVDEEPRLPGLEIMLAVMTLTVCLSVVAHGATARPLARAYGRSTKRLRARAPELASVPQLPTRRI